MRRCGFFSEDHCNTYSVDLTYLLATHDVIWSKQDRFCANQYMALDHPKEFPTMPVRTEIVRLPELEPELPFEKFNFGKEVEWDD